ncbi:MAG TPA: 4-(cytidine 5'-diphospho)-2-C-methyl-D-erythritol kinase, partial [Planctomycetota bacterium]|nr:4-(cytidine 5'-diphospho)-2-C-methyl-D-erythritol kinase [Planctomycetota bacterium]
MNVRSDAIDGRFRRVGERRVEGVAPAKLNLFLEVLGRRPDGYHELRTVFHEIDLCDELSLELLPDGAVPTADALEASGRPIEGPPGQNLVLRAVAAYRRRVPHCPPVRAALRKVVPPGSGTGGGSSDAAFVLAALQHLLGAPLAAAELRAVASEVGADVGFFLLGGTALGAGRGDELTPVETPHAFTFVVAFPSFSLSTARVYEHVDL